jgi:hypothetical protein
MPDSDPQDPANAATPRWRVKDVWDLWDILASAVDDDANTTNTYKVKKELCARLAYVRKQMDEEKNQASARGTIFVQVVSGLLIACGTAAITWYITGAHH